MQQKEQEALIKKIVQTTMETERQMQRQKVLHNTRILMENYIEMKRHIEYAVSETEEMETEEYVNTHLDSVRRSRMKTALMITNIDRSMDELRKEYESKGMKYKYEAFRLHYIEGIPYEDIADIQDCGKNTPSRWAKELIRKMSVKLFGVDGIEKY